MSRILYTYILLWNTEAPIYDMFFYRLTGYQKYGFTKEEYQILTDPYNLQMVIFYQYLLYIIYRRQIPCTIAHFQYVNEMLEKIEKKEKQLTKNRK